MRSGPLLTHAEGCGQLASRCPEHSMNRLSKIRCAAADLLVVAQALNDPVRSTQTSTFDICRRRLRATSHFYDRRRARILTRGGELGGCYISSSPLAGSR